MSSPSTSTRPNPSTSTPPPRFTLIALCLAGIGLAACAPASAPPSDERAAFRYADEGGTRSQVDRSVAPDGTETLHAVTEIRAGGSVATRIVEDVVLDARGRLVHARIARSGLRSAADRVVLDAVAGSVVLVQSGVASSVNVPTDLPWAYPQVLDASGRAITTPVTAWVAARAAAASPSVRVIAPDARSRVVPRDQLAAPTESGTTVILGWDGADVGASFVTRVRLASLGTTLVLGGPPASPSLPCN